jgi:hypothetical protein
MVERLTAEILILGLYVIVDGSAILRQFAIFALAEG